MHTSKATCLKFVTLEQSDKIHQWKEKIAVKLQDVFFFFSKTFDIECNIPSGSLDKRLDLITITFDGATTRRKAVNFTYLENPLLDDMPAKKGIAR